MLTQKEVRRLLGYNPFDGTFTWLVTDRAGKEAGYRPINKSNGGPYTRIGIQGKVYAAHRLVWLWVYGYFPEHGIDHIDRDGFNNRLDNLREVSQRCNLKNSRLRSDNTSGVKGVTWVKSRGKWLARIKTHNIKTSSLIESFDEAVCCRLAMEQCLNWEGCDSNSTAYQYVKNNIQTKE